MRLLVWREHPADGVEVALGDDPARWAVLWRGPTPSGPTRARVLASGQWEGGPAWLEHRAPGSLLSELGALSAPEVASVALDLAERLELLHRTGGVHGRLDADHVVIDLQGRASVIGASRAGGSPADDARQLRALLRERWPEGDAPQPVEDPAAEDPPVETQPIDALAQALSGWLERERPGFDASALGERVASAAPAAEALRPMEWEIDPGLSPADEVSYALGPDTDITGIFSAERTNLSDNTRELTQDFAVQGLGVGQRVRVLARLLSPMPAGDPDRFDEGRSSQAIKALIASEPIDPLPLPDGVPMPQPAPPPEPEAPAGPEPPAHAPASQEEISPRAIRLVALATLATMILLGGIGYYVLFFF